MRIIDVVKEKKSIAICYAQVEQPMYVYHSFEELMQENARHIAGGNFVLVNHFLDYQRMINLLKIDLNYNPNKRYVDLIEHNIWIKTTDEFIPDSANRFGEIVYVLTDKGEKIPTDGVYVRLYFILPTPSRHVLFTSSGVHSIGMTKWEITGAIREWYTQESDARTRGRGTSYQDYITKLANKRRPDVAYIKLAFAIFHPMSPDFMNIERSVKKIWGTRVKTEDREKLIKSKAFKEAMISAIRVLFPELVNAVRNEIPPEDMAKKLAEIYKMAVDSKDVDKMLKVFQKIEDVGYSSQSDPISNLLGMGDSLSDPLKKDDETKKIEAAKLEEIRQNDNSLDAYISKPANEDLISLENLQLDEKEADKIIKDEQS